MGWSEVGSSARGERAKLTKVYKFFDFDPRVRFSRSSKREA